MKWELRYYKKPKDVVNLTYKEERENYDYIVLGSFDTFHPEMGFCYRWFTFTKDFGKKWSDEYELKKKYHWGNTDFEFIFKMRDYYVQEAFQFFKDGESEFNRYVDQLVGNIRWVRCFEWATALLK